MILDNKQCFMVALLAGITRSCMKDARPEPTFMYIYDEC